MNKLLIPVAVFVTVFYNTIYIIHCVKKHRIGACCGMIIITVIAVLLACMVIG